MRPEDRLSALKMSITREKDVAERIGSLREGTHEADSSLNQNQTLLPHEKVRIESDLIVTAPSSMQFTGERSYLLG
jgi:hypothetical protein